MTEDSGSGRPPGWARSPSAFRARGSSLFPLTGTPLRPREEASTDGPSARDALTRLEVPARITALLVVLAPLLDQAVLFSPPIWGSRAWRVGVASTLPGTLLLPTAGALALALLAIARPGRVARGLALAAAGLCALLAAGATGVLAAELFPARDLPFEARAPVVWAAARAAVTAVANVAVAWSLAGADLWRTGRQGVAPSRLPGIELID